MNLIESESDDEQLVDISVDLEMSQSQSTQASQSQSSLVADLKDTALYSIERANQLRQILRENEEHAERKRKLDEMLREEEEKKPRLDDDDNIQLDESQQNLIKNMVKNVDPLIELIPNLDEWFDLKNFNPPVYEYPSECFSDEYKSIIAKFLDDVSYRSINNYVLGFRDLMRFTTFFQLIPTQELKKQVLNCFILNSLTMKSPIAFHDISSMLEKILTSVDLGCSEWYFSSSLFYQFFLSMGFCQDKFNNCFSNQINFKPINNLKRLTQGENITDSDQDLTKSNKRLNKSMIDMILINIVQLLKKSIEIKAHYYSENELKSIFYLICALILDKNFQSDISLLGELNSLLAELFRNEQIDLNELTDTLSNLIRLEGEEDADQKKSRVNILHHRLLFLLNALNSSRRIDQIKLLSTKLSVVILQDIFAVFGNDESESKSESQSRNKWDETKIELVIESLEKHAISTFTSSSYAMSNILHAFHIIIDNYFPTLTDHKLVVAYIERLKAVFHKTNQEVRDQMSFNGRAQIKATLCHYSRLCELYLKRYQSLLTRSTSTMSSVSSTFDQSDKDKENKKV